MSNQKPFANDRTPAAQPVVVKRRGSFIGKLVKLVLLLAIAFGGYTGYIHSKNVGEARAIAAKPAGQTDEVARQSAKMVPPWDWTSTERNEYVNMVSELARKGSSVASA